MAEQHPHFQVDDILDPVVSINLSKHLERTSRQKHSRQLHNRTMSITQDSVTNNGREEEPPMNNTSIMLTSPNTNSNQDRQQVAALA